MILGYLYVAVLVWLTAVSVLSLVALKGAAPWTFAGWTFTIAYDVLAATEILRRTHLPFHAPYIALGALAIAFVIAGVRDEPQADPWWWPARLAPTRAQRAKTR